MDDIYGDLENYNDVNALEELRNENTQLKFKLEEYASDMEKLQKDFDKLSSDFKTLEINYSSLLKTAKAEIERKTQIICNLNSEKDMMVLNSIQNTNKSILNIKRNLLRDKSHNYNLRMMKKDNDLDSSKINRKDLRDTKKFDFEKERKDEVRVPSVDTITSVSTEECMEKKLGKSNTYEKNSDTKENITKNKSRAQSIRNRRKSMPILGKQLPKFSSDEENDDNSADETKKTDRYSRDVKSHRNPERIYSEKVKHKISETSGIDEKYSSYHESSRETYYRGKSSRQSDKHRSIRDKYEQSQRLRRHYSPEKSLRKAPRDHSAEYYQRSDYGRHRVLESPPPDWTEIQKRNRRFNYERENQYEDKHRLRYEKRAGPIKHKLVTDHEEPANKRTRTRSSHRNFEVEINQNKHSAENTISTRISDPLQLTSCQSPDYIDSETLTTVKEIVSTADIQLEDPRLKSQKYITQNENDTLVLCTVVGRNVELKPINSSAWNIKRVETPEALKRPPHVNDDLVQQLYQDVDKPVSCMTPESGEIQSDNDLHDVVTDSYFNDIYEEESQRVTELNIHNLYEEETKNSDCNISKVSFNYTHNGNQTHENIKQLDMPLTEYVIDHAKQKNKSDTKITITLFKKETEISVKQRNNEHEKRRPVQHSGEARMLSCKEIVEGDLALSDETSDNIDAQINIKDKRRTRSQHFSLENKTSKISKIKDKKTKEQNACSTNQVEKDEEYEKTKKSKSKRKTHKSKDKSREIDKAVQQTAERQKSNIDTKKTGPIEEKMTDLFGDSSSLITPEDLGISALPSDKYDPLFEDALDANDINVKEITQMQTKIDNKPDEPREVKKEVAEKPKAKEKKKKFENNIEKSTSVETREGDQNEDTRTVKEKNTKYNFVSSVSVEPRERGKNGNIHTINCQAVNKEPDIVSTVIISTGIQPKVCPLESIGRIVDEHIDLNVAKELNIQPSEKTKHQQLQPAIALATSTPYKEPFKNTNLESELRMIETSCNSSENRTEKNENGTPSDLSSNIDMNHQMETDAPDIRIFVRRRKKSVKRTAI